MRKLYTILSILILVSMSWEARSQAPATLSVTVTQVRNGWDCGYDQLGAETCGQWWCIFGPSICCNQPEPRWKARAGYSGANWSGWDIWNAGTRTCDIWSNSKTLINNVNVNTATTFNVDAETWEEDGFAGVQAYCAFFACGDANWDNNYNPACTFFFCGWLTLTFDGDDVHWGPARLTNIDFREEEPCTPKDWGWFYTRDGYGFRLQSNYTFNAPTFTNDITATYSVCPGLPLTFTAATNTSDGYPGANYYQWQSSPNGSTWTNISGATTTSYSITSTNATGSTITTYYRLRATSNCTADFSSRTTNSGVITVNVYASTDPACNLPACNAIYVDPVNGSDANATNRPSTAYRTLQKALSMVPAGNTTLTHIKVASGTTVEPAGSRITMQSNVIVEGGYTSGTGGADWRKSSSVVSIIGGDYTSASPAGKMGIYANGVSSWRLQDLTITTSNGIATTNPNTYGVYVNNCSSYEIVRCTIQPGTAQTGAAGGYGVYVNSSGASGSILDCYIAVPSGVGVEHAVAQNGGTAPSVTFPNIAGASCTINSTQNTGVAVNNPTTTTLLSGTVRSNAPGKFCVNSEIDMTKAAGNWAAFPQTTGSGSLVLLENLKSGSTSFGVGTSPIKVTTTTAGAYDIGVNSGTMSKFLTVAPTSEFNRTWPVIAASPSSLCVGGTAISLSITSGSFDDAVSPATNIKDREWLVYLDPASGGSPSSPLYSITGPFSTAPVVGPINTPGTYIVRYRERHECCGWSKPAFTTITVVADPTVPALTRDPSNATVCEGTQVRSSITFPTDGVGCSNSLQQSIDYGTWGAYTDNTYTGSTAISSIRIRGVRNCASGIGCTPFISAQQEWLVVPQPVVYIQPVPVSVCNGTTAEMSMVVTNGVNPMFQWQYNTTSCGSAFTDIGSPIPNNTLPVSTASNGVTYYQAVISSEAGSGCSNVTSNCATLTVTPHPTSGPVTRSPNLDSICVGASVTASFSSGSDGIGCSDIQEYRYDTTGSWISYSGSIPAAGHTMIEVRNYRGNCDSISGCTSSTPTVVNWKIVPEPDNGTLSKSPNVNAVCIGTVVGAAMATPGTNGVGCSDIIEYRYRSGGTWFGWFSGTSLTTTAAMTDVQFRTYRGNCTPSAGCTSSDADTVSWTVNAQPLLSDPVVSNSGKICQGGSISLNSNISGGASNNTPRWEYYDGSGWVKVSDGTPTGAVYSDTTGAITISGIANIGTYQYRYFMPINSLNCSAVSDTVKFVISAPLTPGMIDTISQNKCNGTAPSPIGMTTFPSGAAGTYNFQWYQDTINASPTCPAVGTPVAGLPATWHPVTTGSGYTTSVFTPPTLTKSVTYLLAVDPTGSPDCSGFVTATGCQKVTVYPTINKGTLTGIDSICGAVGDASPFGFTVSPGCTPPSGGAGTFTYQWYYYNTHSQNVAPTAGSTNTSGWTLIGGATSSDFDPPASYAPLNLTTGQGRSFACMVNATGTPDCDAPTNLAWATGNFYVKISTTSAAGQIGPTPVNLCNATPTLINQVLAPRGPTGSTFGYRWYYRTSTPTNNVGNGVTTGTNFNTQAWTAVTPASNTPTLTPPNNIWGSGDTLIFMRMDTVKTQCATAPRFYTNWVKFVRNSDNALITVLSSTTASQTKALVVNKWYNFWNSNCELIASVNPNGENLGNVTMAVNVDSLYKVFPNGGYGRDGSCLNKPELAMGRYYTMTTENTPASGTTLVRLYYNTNDYNSYSSAIAALSYVSTYQICYGYPNSPGDLAISRNALTDMTLSPITFLPTTPNIWVNEFVLPPSLLRIGSPEGITAGPTTYHFHTNGGIGGPLPVELISFIGWNEGEINKLQWTTASEENSAKYIVERSVSASNDWAAIGELPAAGNSNSPLTYNFTDVNPLLGNNYYRLKMLDLDGQFEYSNVINIPVNTISRNAFLGIYPNPTNGLLNIDIQAAGKFNTELKVYDVLGQVVTTKLVSLNKGLNKIQMDYSGLANAGYILTFTDNNGARQQVKFIKK